MALGSVPLLETPDQQGAYPRLSDGQLDALRALGEQQPTDKGSILFREGEEDYDFYVVLDGKVAMVQDDEVIAVHGAGRFLGELSVLLGQPAFFSAEVVEAGS